MAKKRGKSLDPDLNDLVPIFVDEVQDRLERLATLAPRLPDDEDARAEVKRELHTVKGAARMLQLGQIAELAHATEALVLAAPPEVAGVLTRVVDRLSSMVDAVAAGKSPEPDPDLLAAVTGALGEDDEGQRRGKRPASPSAGKSGGKGGRKGGMKRPVSAPAGWAGGPTLPVSAPAGVGS